MAYSYICIRYRYIFINKFIFKPLSDISFSKVKEILKNGMGEEIVLPWPNAE